MISLRILGYESVAEIAETLSRFIGHAPYDVTQDDIVSGDKRLKSLGIYRDIPILTARDFVEQLNQGTE